jgi:hypothetical protein
LIEKRQGGRIEPSPIGGHAHVHPDQGGAQAIRRQGRSLVRRGGGQGQTASAARQIGRRLGIVEPGLHHRQEVGNSARRLAGRGGLSHGDKG